MGELAAPVVVLRVTVRAPDLDAFITRYSRHIAGDRIFIFSKAPQPVGTAVRFNLQLQTGEVLIQGRGTVKRVQQDVGDPRHPPGMEVQFTPLDERSATLVDFMMATRAGLTEAVASATAPPIVRAVVPPKPKPATPVPKLSSLSKPSLPKLEPSTKVELWPKSEPSTKVDLAPKPEPSTKTETPPPLPPLPSVKSKPIPVARPPSLSLESVWKSEAGEEATSVSPMPASDSSQPIPTTPAASTPAATAEPAMPLLSAQDSSPSLLSLANLSALPSGASVPPPADSPITTLPETGAPPSTDAPMAPPSSADLATIIPPTVDPSINEPPVFAESWGGDAPANPFSDVSDGAIEYFVEWSLEQSIGPRALPQAQFSDVPMALPGHSGKFAAFDPVSPRRRWLRIGAVFAAGALVGGLVVGVVKRAPRASSAPLVAAVEAPATAAPTPPTTPEPAAAPEGDGALAIITRPPGASVTIDGDTKGTTPMTAHLAAGKHEVVVTKERYAAITTTTEAPGKLALDLRRPSATLHVTSTPPAADVIIAGERRGKTPVDVRLPGFESYDVRVALAGSRPWRKTVYLSHAQNRVDAALASAKPAAPPRAGRR